MTWSACEGAVLAGVEICNEKDDDCDGLVDENVHCVTTLAGSVKGYQNNKDASLARFNEPRGLVLVPKTNDELYDLYVADTSNYVIRKVEARGDPRVKVEFGVQLWAGIADPIASSRYLIQNGYRLGTATFVRPIGLAIDNIGNLYVSDQGNRTIRKIGVNDQVETYAGEASTFGDYVNGKAYLARFNEPTGLALTPKGAIIVADSANNRLRLIEQKGNDNDRMVSLFAGTGTPGRKDGSLSEASFDVPSDLAIDGAGNVFVVDHNNHCIRKIDTRGQVTTFAGNGQAGHRNGPAHSATFRFPRGIALALDGSLYIADTGNHLIRKLQQVHQKPCGEQTNYTGWCVFTFAGKLVLGPNGLPEGGFANGDAGAARFFAPWAVVVNKQGNVFVSDTKNHQIRKISPGHVSASP